ncbi:S8 family serine peptidase, partial [Candidatus Saccharibacteria bacterium]|nr:S8 family serine peptidase [Candidatus Saccharibacteria bacterium]
MSNLKTLINLIVVVLFLPSVMLANGSLSVDLRSERHRTEWNWVEYRVTLTNVSTKTISNPVIQYFAENTNIQYCEKNMNKFGCSGMKTGNYGLDSMLTVAIDYTSYPFQTNSQVISAGKYTVVNLKTKGSLKSGKTLTMHFRLYRKDWGAWDCSRDYSYQKNAAVKEKNNFMAVYDENRNILWGYNPLDGANGTGNVVWSSRNKHQVIEKFKGGEDKVMPQGRFWILKDSVFTKNEKDSLKVKGIDVIEVSTYLGQTLLFSRASVPVSLKSLQQQLSGFYNAFSVDDTTSLSLILGNDDLYEKKRVCQENGLCEEMVEEKFSYKLEVMCWPDVGMFACKDIVKSCGGSDALIDRQIVLAAVPRDSVSCLSGNQNVRDLATEMIGKPLDICSGNREYSFDEVDSYTSSVYAMMHLTDLQSSPRWIAELKKDVKTKTWLNGEEYTGEGIIVGIYDTGVDFDNLAFREYDVVKQEYVPRISPWYNEENKNYDLKSVKAGNTHGSRVAGTIGGNGSGSPNSIFRGIAPKVKFYSFEGVYNRQYGHVINHSTGMGEKEGTYYGKNFGGVDENIFKNWTLFSDKGDFLTKTIVVAAGNNGDVVEYGSMRGFHSMLSPFKNAIVVGAIDARFLNTVSDFSSLGPTWDGRIKPDIMAHGAKESFITATTVGKGMIKNYDYDFFCGTSLSSPIVSGVVALMYQKFRNKTGMPLDLFSMRNSTTKAMLIHTAVDMEGSHSIVDVNKTMGKFVNVRYGKGPDFITGWGRVNAKGALDIIEGYDATTQKFERFREFEIYNGMVKKWTFNIPTGANVTKARVTLVWDDAVPSIEAVSVDKFTKSKLVNDLDMYLVSPSGKRFYPWKLDPLPTEALNEDGRESKDPGLLTRTSGFEKITLEEAEKGAYKYCKDPEDFYTCFDHLNNVEVVDVEGDSEGDLIETGEWQVVVEGYKVITGNSTDGFAQVTSIVSDFKLEEPACFKDGHPYLRNKSSSCVHPLGDYLENYVTFDSRTYVAPGDWIYLYDSADKLIGAYTGYELSGKTVIVRTNTLKVVLESNDDNQQGWG